MHLRPRRLGATALSAACLVLASASAADAVTMSQSFTSPGAAKTFDVPAGVTELEVTAVGGRGGSSGGPVLGGSGGRVTGTLTVTPESRLWVTVGGNAGGTSCPYAGSNGGALGGNGWCTVQGGGGGGAADVRVCEPGAPCPDAPGGDALGRLLVAGGGGGAGRWANDMAGVGGNAGEPGGSVSSIRGTGGGGGAGTATAGGAAGVSGEQGSPWEPTPPQPGTLGAGGLGGTGLVGALTGGGGGGGGFYGGGGGGSANYYAGGGGGGSNLVPEGGTAETDTTGVPGVKISWEAGPPATVDQPTLASPMVYADGSATTTVTVVVRDEHGVPVRGADVSFAATAPQPQIGPTTDNEDGSYSATVTGASTRGATTITAKLATPDRTSEPVVLQQVDRPSVTSPVDGSGVIDPDPGAATVTVSGTADPLTPTVDVYCVGRTAVRRLTGAEAVPVTDGRWTVTDATLPTTSNDPNCRLVATAAGTAVSTTDTGAQPGPHLRRLVLRSSSFGEGAFDYSAAVGGLLGEPTLNALGAGCGVTLRMLTNPRFARGPLWLDCGAAFPDSGQTIDGEGALVIDGRVAYTAGSTTWLFGPTIAGAPTMTVDSTQADDGSFVVTERGPARRCTGTDLPTYSSGTCGSLTDAGVTVVVRTRIAPSGTTVSRTIDFESTDGAAHAVTMTLESAAGYDDPELRVGAEIGWRARDTAERTDPTLGRSSVLVRDQHDLDLPALAITTVPGPSAQVVHGNELLQRFTRNVPAGGTAGVGLNFALTARGSVEITAAEAEAGYAVGVAITTPDDDTSVEAETVTLTGTASDAAGATQLRVAGQPVSVDGDGRWSATVPLSVGENEIEAVVESRYGPRETASVTVTRTVPTRPADPDPPTTPTEPTTPTDPNPPTDQTPGGGSPTPPGNPTPPAAKPQLLRSITVPKRARLAQIRKRGLSIPLTLSSGRTRISVELRGPWGVLASSSTTQTTSGKATLRLKPTRKAAAKAAGALRRSKTVKLRLKLTVRGSDGTTQTVTRTIQLRR